MDNQERHNIPSRSQINKKTHARIEREGEREFVLLSKVFGLKRSEP